MEGWVGRRRAATADALSSRRPWVATRPSSAGVCVRVVCLANARKRPSAWPCSTACCTPDHPTPSAARTEPLELAWGRGSFARVDIHATTPMPMALSQTLFDAIVDGKAALAKSLVEQALASGADPMAIISETMIPAMDEVGKLFQEEEFFVPELMRRRPSDESGDGAAAAAARGRRGAACRRGRCGNRQGRPARHRQEPRRLDARRRRLRSRRPRHGRVRPKNSSRRSESIVHISCACRRSSRRP